MTTKTTARRIVVLWAVALSVSLLTGVGASPGGTTAKGSSVDLVATLQQGNQRYVAGRLQPKDFAQERHALSMTQHPYAIVLSCSDSRVPPELLFDESLGRLFVIRVAGNVVDPDVLGSVEYAAKHLGVALLVVMGHDRCGAVSAALGTDQEPKNVMALAAHIAPAAQAAKAKGLDASHTVDAAVRENVRLQMKQALAESELIRDLVAAGTLRIVGAVYHLESGEVEWL